MKKVAHKWRVAGGECRESVAGGQWPVVSATHPISNPSRDPSPRQGIILLEVLIAIFVLLFGLLAVAVLVVVGGLSLGDIEKSDRTGICGRAALHDLKIRGLLNSAYWDTTGWPQWYAGHVYVPGGAVVPTTANGHYYACITSGTAGGTEPTWPVNGGTVTDGTVVWQDVGTTPPPFVLDPLGQLAISNAMEPMPRLNMRTAPLGSALNAAQADALFRSHDDLIFVLPEDQTGTKPPAGTRPTALLDGTTVQYAGETSWFLTIAPTSQPQTYSVAVVVCYGRVLSSTSEKTCTVNAGVAPTIALGGGVVTFTNPSTGTVDLVPGNWIILSSATQACWYRVAFAGPTGTNSQMLQLIGPDWLGGPATATIVDGVTGVYTSTVRLN